MTYSIHVCECVQAYVCAQGHIGIYAHERNQVKLLGILINKDVLIDSISVVCPWHACLFCVFVCVSVCMYIHTWMKATLGVIRQHSIFLVFNLCITVY